MKLKDLNFIILILSFIAFNAGCTKNKDLKEQHVFISRWTSGDIEYDYHYDHDYRLTSIQRKYISTGGIDLEIQYSDYDENNIPRRADYIQHLGPGGPVYYLYELDNSSRVKEYRAYDHLNRLQFTVQFYYLLNRIESIETLSPSGIKIKIIYTVNGNGNVVKLDRITNDTVIVQSNSYLAHDDQHNWQSLLPPTALFNEIHSVNNATKAQFNSIASGVTINRTINMEYNSDGYPVKAIAAEEGDSAVSEMLYEYIRR